MDSELQHGYAWFLWQKVYPLPEDVGHELRILERISLDGMS